MTTDSHDHDDRDLAARFAEARARDTASAPAFHRVLAGRARRRWHPWLVPAFALGALTVVAVALSTWRTAQRPDAPPAFAIVPGEMRVPTDYFLDVAITVRAGELPSIGAVDWYPLVPADADPTTDSRRRN